MEYKIVFYNLLNVPRLHTEGFPRNCFKAHNSSESTLLIVMKTKQGHLHIVAHHNLPSVDWTAHSVVLKVVERWRLLHEITVGYLPLEPQNSIFHLLLYVAPAEGSLSPNTLCMLVLLFWCT